MPTTAAPERNPAGPLFHRHRLAFAAQPLRERQWLVRDINGPAGDSVAVVDVTDAIPSVFEFPRESKELPTTILALLLTSRRPKSRSYAYRGWIRTNGDAINYRVTSGINN